MSDEYERPDNWFKRFKDEVVDFWQRLSPVEQVFFGGAAFVVSAVALAVFYTIYSYAAHPCVREGPEHLVNRMQCVNGGCIETAVLERECLERKP